MSPQIISSLGVQFNYTEANIGSCPFVLGVNKYKVDGTLHKTCIPKYQNVRYSLVNNKPSIILIGGRYPLYLSSVGFDNKEFGVEGGKWDYFKSIDGSSFQDSFKKTIGRLSADGHQIILIYPIPEVGVHVPKYIFKNQKSLRSKSFSEMQSNFKPLTTNFDIYVERSKSTFEMFDYFKTPNIHRVYPHTLFCDNQIKGRCVTHNEEDIFYADHDHPSTKGSEMIVELIMDKILVAEEIIRLK